MVEIISGKKGKGKTKYLLERVNDAIKDAKGTIVYLDKSAKHMYELNNKIRLINVTEYPIKSFDAFFGFLCGLISQDHDLEQMYLDSFLNLANLESEDVTDAILQLDKLSQQYGIKFVISLSLDEGDLSDVVKQYVTLSL